MQATTANSGLVAVDSTGSVAAIVGPGGALIDTQSYSVTIPQGLQSGAVNDGGLTKYGDGILTLTGSNTYLGATTVSAGTLQIGNGGELNPAARLLSAPMGHWPSVAATRPSKGPISLRRHWRRGRPRAGRERHFDAHRDEHLQRTDNRHRRHSSRQRRADANQHGLRGRGATLAGSGLIGGNTSLTTLTPGGVIGLSGGTIGGPLIVTGGNWTGFGTVSGLVTSSSNVFAVASGGTLNAASNMNVSGGALTGQGTISGGTVTLGSGGVIAPGATPAAGNVGTFGAAQPRHRRRRHPESRPLQ